MKPLRNRTRQAVHLGLAILALAALSTAALAQISADQQSAIRGNCRADFISNCSGVPRGGKEALDCLRQHMAQLSPACGSAVKAVTPPPAAAAPPPPPAPKVEKKKVEEPPPATPPPPPPAAAAPPPPPAATAPAPAPKQQAAPAPKAVAPKVEKRKAPEPAPAPAAVAPAPIAQEKIEALSLPKRLAITRHCRADLEAVCPSVKRGGGRLIACLATHRSALSAACRQALEKELQ